MLKLKSRSHEKINFRPCVSCFAVKMKLNFPFLIIASQGGRKKNIERRKIFFFFGLVCEWCFRTGRMGRFEMDRRELPTQTGNLRRLFFSFPFSKWKWIFSVFRSLLNYFLRCWRYCCVHERTHACLEAGWEKKSFKTWDERAWRFFFIFIIFERKKFTGWRMVSCHGRKEMGKVVVARTIPPIEAKFFSISRPFHFVHSHPRTHFSHTFYTQRGDFLLEKKKMKRKVYGGRLGGWSVGVQCFVCVSIIHMHGP